MKTENLVNLLQSVNVWADDKELLNITVDGVLQSEAWLFKHVVSVDEDMKNYPLYGSYLVTYHRDFYSFEQLEDMFDDIVTSSELFPYESIGVANIAKNTHYPIVGLFHIGCMAEESLG